MHVGVVGAGEYGVQARLGCVGEDVGTGQERFAGRVQGVALAAAMPQGFLLDALAALL